MSEERDWLRNLTDVELVAFAAKSWKASHNGGRLGMTDAYNYHRDRARAAEREIERRATPCSACQGRGKDEYMGIVLPKACWRCDGKGYV